MRTLFLCPLLETGLPFLGGHASHVKVYPFACRGNSVHSFLCYFKTLSFGLALGIKPTTSCSVVKHSTNWANPNITCIQSVLSKRDTFGTDTECLSQRDIRLIESQIKGAKRGRDQLKQGSYRSWKTWKVVGFMNFIFQAWKIMEFNRRPLKVMEN